MCKLLTQRILGRRQINQYSASACVLAVSAMFLLVSGSLQAEPYTPSHDGVVLQALPKGSKPPVVPAAAGIAARLQQAEASLATGRQLNNPRYYGFAEAQLQGLAEIAEPPAELLLLRARIKQFRHDFAAAKADLDQLLKQQPQQAEARLLRASIAITQADYRAAQADCQILARNGHSWIASVCLAQIRSLTGFAEQAEKQLQQQLRLPNKQTAALNNWAWTVLADTAVRMQQANASDYFAAARQADAADVYTQLAYADWLLANSAHAEVMATIPPQSQHEGLLLRRALAAQALGLAEATTLLEQMQARFAAQAARGEPPHGREYVRFLLELQPQMAQSSNAQQAYDLALRNWQVHKEPADTLLVYQAALAWLETDWAAAKGGLTEWQSLETFVENTGQQDLRRERLGKRINAVLNLKAAG